MKFETYIESETARIEPDSYKDVLIDVSSYGNRSTIGFAYANLNWCVGGAWWEDDTHIHVQMQNPFSSTKNCLVRLALFTK